MKSFVIISDTHRNRAAIDRLEGVFAECDYIIHLGDLSSDGDFIREKYPQKTIVLNGNCDIDRLGEDERILETEGVKIFMCHGHRYSVKQTLDKLAYAASEKGCSVALYGHTHIPRSDEIGGVKLINPGALTRYAPQSYCFMTVHCGKCVEKIVALPPSY